MPLICSALGAFTISIILATASHTLLFDVLAALPLT